MIQITYERIIDRLTDLSRRVPRINDLTRHAKDLADIADDRDPSCIQCAWLSMWDKPLFANSRVETAHAQRRFLLDAFPELETVEGMCFLKKPENMIVRDKGHWQARDTYAIPHHHPWASAEVTSARYRLKAIENIAVAISSKNIVRDSVSEVFEAVRAEVMSIEDIAPLAEKLSSVLQKMAKAFGTGIGHVTVAHALTDLGVAVKPDIWVCRTLQELGLSSLRLDEKNPSVRQCAELIAGVIAIAKSSELSDFFDWKIPEVGFSKQSVRWQIRFVDFYLMRMKRPEGNIDVEIPPTRCLKHVKDWDICVR